MKKQGFCLTACAVTLTLWLAGCASTRILTPETQHIVGHYAYAHSWDYTSPDKQQMHCDEEGTLDFYADGTCSDTATQHHTLTRQDGTTERFDFNYRCQGRWKVEEHHFMFKELAEDFQMQLIDSLRPQEYVDFAHSLARQALPNSQRWITFDIERLDSQWFIWSYTYPNGRKDTWDMRRR